MAGGRVDGLSSKGENVSLVYDGGGEIYTMFMMSNNSLQRTA